MVNETKMKCGHIINQTNRFMNPKFDTEQNGMQLYIVRMDGACVKHQ